MEILGLDIGGTGTKGAIVDIEKGILVSDRIKLATPQPANAELMSQTVGQLIELFNWKGDVGMGFPCVIRDEICMTANNIDKSWIGRNIYDVFRPHVEGKFTIINDADAAGMAEYGFGAAKGKSGLVVLITLGTGIGSSFIFNGQLIPNVELGSIPWRDGMAEDYASNKHRKENDLSWKEWGVELNVFINYIERIYFPEMIILGGGVSKKFEKYSKYIHLKDGTPLTTAAMLNEAGIVGAAYACYKKNYG